jgi:ABC-type multidrug transport system ATPase subunit
MTALTTILGLLPMAVRTDEEIEWAGLAIVVIGGLSVSTVLTLVVIPSMLMMFEDVLAFLKRVALWLVRRRWLLYIFWPPWMRAKRLQLVPAGVPTAFVPTFATAMQRVTVDERPKPLAAAPPPEPEKQDDTADAERPLGVEVRHVRMTYPVFRLRKALHVIPSRQYKWGARPPQGVDALRGVNLSIGKGIFGLVGPNGAGKTTLLNIITGLVRPTCGYVAINGIDMAREGRRARREIGFLPQSFGLHGSLTAREYLTYYSLIQGIADRAERRRNVEAILDQVGLRDVGDEPVATFSGGMRQRLGIARVLLTLPPVIIVDEPTAGLDPIERVKFRVLLSELSTDRAVLLSTHIIDDISSSCRQLAVLNDGKIAYDGTPQGLIATARDRIWEVVGRLEDEAAIQQRYRLLHKKAAGPDRVLFRFITTECDLPDAQRVEPSLEDAYVFAITQDTPSP